MHSSLVDVEHTLLQEVEKCKWYFGREEVKEFACLFLCFVNVRADLRLSYYTKGSGNGGTKTKQSLMFSLSHESDFQE
jgi:hypothetical protein